MKHADVVYINGNIYTMNDELFSASALAVLNGKLIYVGNNTDVKKYIGEDTKVFDLEENTVIPGIIDSHTHFLYFGTTLQEIDAFWKTKEEIISAIREKAEKTPPGDWILGWGWNQEAWADKKFPTKEDLDAVAPNNPVLLKRACGHAFWVNSKALDLANITKDTPNPMGGEILKDSNGEPTGILTDTAGNTVESVIPPYSKEHIKELLKLAQQELFSYGITSNVDAGVGLTSAMGEINSLEVIELMKELYESKELKIRLYGFIPTGENARKYYKKGPEINLFDGRLTIRGIKVFSDGSLGARSAWLQEDYSDRKGHKGNARYSNEELYEIFSEAHNAGFQIAIHCIGDAAIKQAIDTFEKVINKSKSNNDHRFRIDHVQIARLEDIKRLADLKIVASMQFVQTSSDINMIEPRVGKDRLPGTYAWRKILNAGGIIANGSDTPMESVNPFYGLYAGVSRSGLHDGLPKGGWHPEECLTRYEALKAYTLGAAYAQFAENQKGSLEIGKYADFVVIDKDYMTCGVNEIKSITALKTVVGGEIVYTKP